MWQIKQTPDYNQMTTKCVCFCKRNMCVFVEINIFVSVCVWKSVSGCGWGGIEKLKDDIV